MSMVGGKEFLHPVLALAQIGIDRQHLDGLVVAIKVAAIALSHQGLRGDQVATIVSAKVKGQDVYQGQQQTVLSHVKMAVTAEVAA